MVLAYLGTEGIPPPLEHYHLELLKAVAHPLGDTHSYSLCNQLGFHIHSSDHWYPQTAVAEAAGLVVAHMGHNGCRTYCPCWW